MEQPEKPTAPPAESASAASGEKRIITILPDDVSWEEAVVRKEEAEFQQETEDPVVTASRRWFERRKKQEPEAWFRRIKNQVDTELSDAFWEARLKQEDYDMETYSLPDVLEQRAEAISMLPFPVASLPPVASILPVTRQGPKNDE